MDSLAVAERIRQRVANIHLPRQLGLQMELHYGIATYPADGRTSDFLIKTCDVRLYDSAATTPIRARGATRGSRSPAWGSPGERRRGPPA